MLAAKYSEPAAEAWRHKNRLAMTGFIHVGAEYITAGTPRAQERFDSASRMAAGQSIAFESSMAASAARARSSAAAASR